VSGSHGNADVRKRSGGESCEIAACWSFDFQPKRDPHAGRLTSTSPVLNRRHETHHLMYRHLGFCLWTYGYPVVSCTKAVVSPLAYHSCCQTLILPLSLASCQRLSFSSKMAMTLKS
jgi:hypothetical protein